MKRRIAFIINGRKRIYRPIQNIIDRILSSEEFESKCCISLYHKHAIVLATEKANEGFEIIIAVGGDGTCNEVVNGIMKSTRKEPVFAVLPNGTGNDFQKTLGEFDSERFYQSLRQKRTRKIDLCIVKQGSNSIYSLNIAGIGLDGHVIQLLNRQRLNWKSTGKLSYAIAISRAFFTYRKPKVIVDIDNFRYEGKMLMLAACNASTFGHGLIIAPDAFLDDGLLNVVLLAKVSLIDYIRNLSKLKRGIKIEHPEVFYFTTDSLTLNSLAKNIYCEADGEILGAGNVNFSVSKSALTLLDSFSEND